MQLHPTRPGGPAGATTPARLLAALAADARPRLTWYGGAGARVELSGRVLTNWVTKTANLLLDEADVEAGSVVHVRLDADWRVPVFWLAARYLGAEVHDRGPVVDRTGAAVPSDVLVVPEGRTGDQVATRLLVVVGAAAVAGPLSHAPPAGALDYGREVGGQPDALPAPGPQQALAAQAAGRWPTGARVLLGPDARAEDLVAVWVSGGSVVWHVGLGPDALVRVRAQENVSG